MRRIILTLVLLLSPCSSSLAGFTEGMTALARNDVPAALREFIEAANSGDTRAQLVAALLYAAGKGIAHNDSEAMKWFRRAAEQGNPHAQFNLAVMYHTERGIARNMAEAERWYRKAAEQGLAQAQGDLGAMYLSQTGVKYNYPEALNWLRKAADSGHAIAQFNLAGAYLMGGSTAYTGEGIGFLGPEMGVSGTIYPKDEAEASKWLLKAAEQGHVVAQFNLGLLYEKGLGVERNHATVVKWYRAAVESGFTPAMNNLAALYESGTDVVRDPVVALQLRQRSSRAGYHSVREFPYLLIQLGAASQPKPPDSTSGAIQPKEKRDVRIVFIPGFSIDPALSVAEAPVQRTPPSQQAALAAPEPAVPLVFTDLAQYIEALQNRIKRYIIAPADAPASGSIVVELALLPSGEVLGIRLLQPSGHKSLDTAIERAIVRAQPLPVMRDVREVRLVFKIPE